ncbi:hypothetical protein BU16DRAFT_543918 [Lophium mytilinum]|uniref:Uncharacterized protein n=1 Tax=Lophium mytilinum TaxID=390894 RepID=A0A6A6QEA7_9PEZI|nr:hypothetical protein BU16DRAFT_543918 [Lophium mytilinum]
MKTHWEWLKRLSSFASQIEPRLSALSIPNTPSDTQDTPRPKPLKDVTTALKVKPIQNLPPSNHNVDDTGNSLVEDSRKYYNFWCSIPPRITRPRTVYTAPPLSAVAMHANVSPPSRVLDPPHLRGYAHTPTPSLGPRQASPVPSANNMQPLRNLTPPHLRGYSHTPTPSLGTLASNDKSLSLASWNDIRLYRHMDVLPVGCTNFKGSRRYHLGFPEACSTATPRSGTHVAHREQTNPVCGKIFDYRPRASFTRDNHQEVNNIVKRALGSGEFLSQKQS